MRSSIATQGYRPFSRLGVATHGYRGVDTATLFACPPVLTIAISIPLIVVQIVEFPVLQMISKSPQLVLQAVDLPILNVAAIVPTLELRECHE